MYCPQCGNQNPDNSRFCGSCGAPLENIRTHAGFPQMGEATGRVGSEGRGDPKKDPNRKRKWILAVPVVAVIAAAVPVVVLLVLPNNAGENPSVEAQVQEAESTPTEIPKQETEDPSDLGEKTVEIYPGSHPYGQEISQTMQEEVSGEADPENLQGNASYYNELTLLEKKEQEMEDSATDQVSMNRVSGEIYEMWDDELNYVYQQLKKTLTEEEFQQLKEEELQWIEYRDQLGEEAAKEWEGGSGMPMAVNTALSEATKTRTYELAYRWISGWRP